MRSLYRTWVVALLLAGLAGAGWLLLRMLAPEIPAQGLGDQPLRLSDEKGPSDPQAKQAFLQARQQMATGDLASLRTSRGSFERAAALAPDYAPAHLGQAWTAWLSEGESRELRQTALQGAKAALKLAPHSPEAHLLRAEIAFYHEWDASLAQKHYRQALELGAGLKEVHAAYALFAALTGRLDAAGQHAEMALDLGLLWALDSLPGQSFSLTISALSAPQWQSLFYLTRASTSVKSSRRAALSAKRSIS